MATNSKSNNGGSTPATPRAIPGGEARDVGKTTVKGGVPASTMPSIPAPKPGSGGSGNGGSDK